MMFIGLTGRPAVIFANTARRLFVVFSRELFFAEKKPKVMGIVRFLAIARIGDDETWTCIY